MNSNISTSFFSREALLKRQARTLRSRKLNESSLRNKPLLNIIVEEDETRTSSRSPSPVLSLSPSSTSGSSSTHSLKAKRRRAIANVSDIKIARESTGDDDIELSPLLLSAPRPAPSPPTYPSESPDSFSLTFTDVAYKFPHPPTPSSPRRGGCESPTPSMSSVSSSPCSRNGDMPLTPSSSDDESSTRSRLFDPRRAAIQPLVIAKHNPRPSSPFSEISLSSSSLLQPFKDSSEESTPITSLTSAFVDDVYSYDSDPESDSEWYNREFSDFLSLYSPTPSSFPIQQSRPESMFLSEDVNVASPKSQRRVSKVLPPTPSTPASRRESVVVPLTESQRSSKRASKRISIPKYPPPPVPSMNRASSVSSRTSSPTSIPACNKTLPQTIRRPPPRTSIPLDCEFEFDLAEIEEGDSSSAFSFSMYEIDLDYGVAANPESPGSSGSDPSVYSQPSFEEDDDHFDGNEITFDLDYSLMLPLSLPTTPMDLEADIALGLEKLRTVQEETEVELPNFFVEEQQPAPQPQPQQEVVVDDVFSPSSSSSFSFSPSPSVASHFNDYSPAVASSNITKRPLFNEEKILKSKWSSSTLGSVREEHEQRAPASKLRLYFGGQSPSKSSSKRGSAQSSKKVPPTPTSPFSLMTPRKASRGYAASPPPSASPSARGHFRGGSSDVMIIGYGGGVRRRGSVSTVSDVGSEDSSSSTSSSGLRRKPIPIEMLLRSDVYMKSIA